jgi:hypothetical protein
MWIALPTVTHGDDGRKLYSGRFGHYDTHD